MKVGHSRRYDASFKTLRENIHEFADNSEALIWIAPERAIHMTNLSAYVRYILLSTSVSLWTVDKRNETYKFP
ncbi:hypothetical protein TUZN_0280 [Thermoproteus uzoniensis 768-20]|uniref:Uncharacterized protein n=1 Tax=Thermoproteus uzoniensis (strain 768-20) TaxID=999630 RepID=F2L2B3_THEU7|nr:hypothetical protein TUZN_0280 [Thermoproteus uzoniensis 768-20]